MASTYLTYTPSSAVTLGTKATISFWVKRSKVDTSNTFQGILASNGGWNDGTGFAIGWYADELYWYNLKDGNGYRTYPASLRKFRDINCWYHILYKIDTTQSSVQDRITLYVNGEDQGDMATNTGSGITAAVPNQNGTPYQFFDSGDQHTIGRWGSAGAGSANHLDGSLSYFYYIDGTAYDASTFGSTDATTGEWKINTSPTISSYGNNGFFILKDGNSVTDQSSNSNNFTVGGGTLTKTEDCPSNVFATFNTLFTKQAPSTTNMGNTRLDQSSNAWKSRLTTIGASSGKYYAEFKAGTISGTKYNQFGVVHEDIVSSGTFQYVGDSTSGWGLNWGGNVNHNGSNVSGYTSFTTGDIIGVAMDLDNHKVYWRKNDGAWLNSGDPTSGSTGTGAQSLTTGKIYFFAASVYGNECFANFGNGYFGTTAVSSAGTNASGNGIFEHDCPNGYTALSSKGLNL